MTAALLENEVEEQIESTSDGQKIKAVRDKFLRFERKLQKSLVGRNDEITASLIGLIAGEHVLMVGEPGIAKSLLVDLFCRWLRGNKFKALLGEFTTPEELFGPLDLAALPLGKYQRLTQNTLADCDIAFLDEIWKASPAILNTTLGVLNEREYRNGDTIMSCPLRLAFAASNEWPDQTGENNLAALFDRFLIRLTVNRVSSLPGLKRMMFNLPELVIDENLDFAELDLIQQHSKSLAWTNDAKDAIEKIVLELRKEKIEPGNRRMVKCVGVANAAAVLGGNSMVEPGDLAVLQHVLWDRPGDQVREVAKVIRRLAVSSDKRLRDAADEMIEALSTMDGDRPIEVGRVEKRARRLIDELSSNDKFVDLAGEIEDQIGLLRRRVFKGGK